MAVAFPIFAAGDSSGEESPRENSSAIKAAESLPDLSQDPVVDSGGSSEPIRLASVYQVEPLDMKNIVAGLPVSLTQLVQSVLAQNLAIKVRRLAPELGEAAVRSAWGEFDPAFGFKLSYDYSQTPQNAQDYVATGGETTQSQQALLGQLVELQDSLDTLIAQLQGQTPSGQGNANQVNPYTDPRLFTSEDIGLTYSLGGKLPWGTTYEFQLRQLQLKNDINSEKPPSLFFPEYSTYAGVAIRQPLLRDFGPAAGLAGVRLARLQRAAGWLDWQQQMIASMAELAGAYFDLIYAAENVRFKQDIAAGAAKIQKQNARRHEMGQLRASDVAQASGAVARANDDMLTALREMIRLQGILSALVQGEAPEAGLIRFVPTDRLSIPEMPVDRSRFLSEAFQGRPEYLKARNEVEKSGIRLRYFRNQALPRLDVESTLGAYGLDGNFGSSLANTAGGQGTAFSIAVVASIPIGNVKGRADLDIAKYQQRQNVLLLKEQEVNLSVDLDVALVSIDVSKMKLAAAAQASRTAEFSLVSERRRLAEGKGDTFTVISLQNEFSTSKTRELAAQADLRKAYLQLAVARGSLLQEFGINLNREATAQTPQGIRRGARSPEALNK